MKNIKDDLRRQIFWQNLFPVAMMHLATVSHTYYAQVIERRSTSEKNSGSTVLDRDNGKNKI